MLDPTDFQSVSNAVLRAINQRTGYPVESLDVDHLLDRDLGMSSFTFAEVLAVLSGMFPGTPLPTRQPERIRDLAKWFYTGPPELADRVLPDVDEVPLTDLIPVNPETIPHTITEQAPTRKPQA